MAQIAPFHGILYSAKKIREISKVVAPPYDVISPEEQEKLYRKSPYNVVRLILNRDPEPYSSIAQLFQDWQGNQVLTRAQEPAIYFLRHRFRLRDGEERERDGFIALVKLEDFSSGNIRPHEKTLDGPKEDRFRLMVACRANLSPIFGLYSEPKQIVNRTLEEYADASPPLIQVKEDSGGVCRLWSITDPGIVSTVQREMENQPVLIADGHHRYEAALRYRDHLRKERSGGTGREPFEYVMMYFANMHDPGLTILPTHRLVRAFRPIPFQKLEETLQRYFYIEPYPKHADGQRWFLRALKSGGKKRHLIGASFKGDPRYLILRLKNKRTMQRLVKDMSAPLRELDVSTLHLLILAHILNLSPEDQVQPDVIRYSEDEEEVLKAVDRADYQAAFILNPPGPEEIMSVVAAGERMPQKSTYFYPKLLTGLVLHKIDPNTEVMDPSGGRD